jgi:hypothetical protein
MKAAFVDDQDALPSCRYRVDVYALSVIDVVVCLGGWIFDHAVAGWDVCVLVPAPFDDRPLRILGAGTADLEVMLQAVPAPRSAAMLIFGGLLSSDMRVRARTSDAMRSGTVEVTTWGQSGPAGLAQHSRVTECQLSTAAVTFKAHAPVAAGASAELAGATEILCRRTSGEYVFGWASPGA